MLELFYEYSSKGKVKQALLVGHNLFNRNTSDKRIFEAFFDYLLYLAKEKQVANGEEFLRQATGALALFSEAVKMDKEVVEFVLEKEEQLNKVITETIAEEDKEKKRLKAQEKQYYDEAMILIERLLKDISQCKDEGLFNKKLHNLGEVDKSIRKDRLSSVQENKYIELTKKSSEIVSGRMAAFEKIKNREYNIKAIEAYEKVFNMFKYGRVSDNHKEDLRGLFMFEPSRLYNETLVYYNYVYSYVLGKLSDEEKFLMTEYAIRCEKIR